MDDKRHKRGKRPIDALLSGDKAAAQAEYATTKVEVAAKVEAAKKAAKTAARNDNA